MIIAWGSNLFGLGLGGLSVKGVGDAFASFGFSVPMPGVSVRSSRASNSSASFW